MGCTPSSNVDPQTVLESSVLYTLVPTEDWEKFCSVIKYETYNISSHLQLSKKCAFYAVISGEVEASLSLHDDNTKTANNPKKGEEKSIVARVFLPGDIIHMFSAKSISHDGHIIENGLKLTYTIKAIKGKSPIIAMFEFDSMKEYIKKYNHTQLLDNFIKLNNTQLTNSTRRSSRLTREQFEILGPLMQIRILNVGDSIICERIFASGSKNKSSMFSKYVDYNSVGMPLTGKYICLHDTVDLEDFRRDYCMQIRQEIRENAKIVEAFKASFRLGSNKVANIDLNLPALSEYGDLQELGNLCGTELYFVSAKMGMVNIVACEPGFAGILNVEVFDVIHKLNQKFESKLLHSLNYDILKSMEPYVPLLSNIPAKELVTLSKKVKFEMIETGHFIYKSGDIGKNFYIVTYGCVEEIHGKDGASRKQNIEDSKSIRTPALPDDQFYFRGGFFGEVAALAESPHITTFRTTENSVVLKITNTDLRSIYGKNKAKLADMKIRMLGDRVNLAHVLEHPVGYKLLLSFVEKEHAAENVEFWQAVERFNEIYWRYANEMKRKEILFNDKSQAVEVLSPRSVHEEALGDSLGMGIGTIIEESESVNSGRITSVSVRAATINEDGVNMENNDGTSSDDEAHGDSGSKKKKNGSTANTVDSEETDSFREKPKVISSAKIRKQSIAAQRATSNPRQVESQLFEIHDVCKAIIEKFIAEGSPHQVNIAYKMRIETEAFFKEWSAAITDIRQKLSVAKESVEVDELEESYAKAKAIFEKPKKEVYELMQKDTYSRLKHTKEFMEFLEEMKPIATRERPSQSTFGGGMSSSNNSVSSRHDILVERSKRRQELNKKEFNPNKAAAAAAKR